MIKALNKIVHSSGV